MTASRRRASYASARSPSATSRRSCTRRASMPRVVGIDPGTVSIDVCGIDDGRLFLDRSFPTGQVLAEPAAFVALLEAGGPLDLVAGPSGYGLPLTRVQDASDEDLRLAFLTAPGETGGRRGAGPRRSR